MNHPFFFIFFCVRLSQVYSLSSSQVSTPPSSQWSSTSPPSSDHLAGLHPPPAQQPSWWKLIWHRKEKLFLVHKIGGHGRRHGDKEMEDKLDIKVKINFAGPRKCWWGPQVGRFRVSSRPAGGAFEAVPMPVPTIGRPTSASCPRTLTCPHCGS